MNEREIMSRSKKCPECSKFLQLGIKEIMWKNVHYTLSAESCKCGYKKVFYPLWLEEILQ